MFASYAYGAVLLFDRTQFAGNVPFDNTGPAASFTSTNVQDAIVEAITDSINNDRYPIQANYGGNGNAGTFLEVFPGEDSNTAPLVMPQSSLILQVTIQASANSNGAIRISNKTTATTLYTANFSGTSKRVFTGLSVGGISANDEITFSVVTASVNKPKIRVWFNTQL
jgi:hypothetical protein